MTEAVYVPVIKLTEFVIEALMKMGVPRPDAELATEILLASDLKGVRSHGIAHLHWYHKRIKAGLQQSVTNWKIVNESPTTAVIDGANGMGMVVGFNAMKIAIQKARQYGMGAVAVRNSSHYGIASYYSRMASNEGMVGMSFTNAHPSIAPTFGVEPLLGTNPIAFAAPTDEEFPFSLDAATSIAPRGKIEIAARAQKPIPEGWVIKEDGTPATDSFKLIDAMNKGKAALLPLGGKGEAYGGHKGYGLATMVEILSASFQDGNYLSLLHDHDKDGNPHPSRIGHFFLVINIANFVPVENFKKTTGNIVRELRSYKKSPDAGTDARIYTAGEKAFETMKKAMVEGIRIPPSVQKNLNAVCAELGITHNLGF
jgi:L-2-hydroxycarboxylate dehydrogenase (NAD+)